MNLRDKIIAESKRADEGWGPAYPLFSRVVNNYGLKVGVEIGVAFGGHSEAILAQTNVTKLYGIDPYRHFSNYDDPMNFTQPEFDVLYEFTRSRLSTFEGRFELVRDCSSVAATMVRDQIDFVYIDALPTYDGVHDDLRVWFPKVRVGGIIGGHDYGHPNFDGVKKAVDEFLSRFGLVVNYEGEGVWWVEKKPLGISFIVPAYNCELTITETLDSIINNNINNGDEIVVVNDASTDGTEALLDKYMQEYDYVHVVNHYRNKGGAAARNTAVENTKNELVFCLDSDNVLVKGSADRLKKHLIKEYADVVSFQELRYFKSCITDVTHKWVFKDGKTTLADALAGGVVPIASGNYLFTKDSWRRAGGYPEFAGALDAWGFGLRQLATGSKMVVLSDSFYYHRYGHESYWIRDFKNGKTSLTALQIIIPYIDQIVDTDIDYIVGRKGRHVWFEQRDQRPLRMKNGVVGTTGYVVNLSNPMKSNGGDVNMFKNLVNFIGNQINRLLPGKGIK